MYSYRESLTALAMSASVKMRSSGARSLADNAQSCAPEGNTSVIHVTLSKRDTQQLSETESLSHLLSQHERDRERQRERGVQNHADCPRSRILTLQTQACTHKADLEDLHHLLEKNAALVCVLQLFLRQLLKSANQGGGSATPHS